MVKRHIEKFRLRLHRCVGKLLAEGRGFDVPFDGLSPSEHPLWHCLKGSEAALFLREMFANPRAVGAAWPSSRHLARAMARGLPRNLQGQVVELGAGTGAVTAALLGRIEGSRLTVVERSPALVHHLQRRYPRLQVIQGDAAELADILGRRSVEVVVSSLPLRAF
ncbi:MAG: methyltransferase domain-containing protein, partial [Gammaproteobacteria bacterium]